jgi:toxin ParE1/3/4
VILTPRFHKNAQAELRSAVAWYEERRKGLGRRFYERVEVVVTRAARGELPGLVVPVSAGKRDIRKVRVPRFPYLVYYERHADECVILAIAHMKRRPGYWLKRSAIEPETPSGAA